MDVSGMTDREILVLTYQSVSDIKHDLYGRDGSDGLIKEFEVVKTKVSERTTKTQTVGIAGGASVILTLLLEFARAKMGS